MLRLKEGTKVKTTTDLIGTVEAIYDMGTVVYYIVKLEEDGSLYKFFEDQLTEIEEEPAPEEPTESDTITITRKEFQDKISNEVAEILATSFIKGDYMIHTVLSKIAPVMCVNIELALFGEPKENV